MGPDLTPALRSSLDRLTHGRSGRELAGRAEAISRRYRAGSASHETIRSAEDAIAYAITRVPATYAATSAVLQAIHEIDTDFSPRTLIDAGAGPGTAAWAAAEEFASIGEIRLIDHNPHLRALALDLLADGASALRHAVYEQGDLVAVARNAAPADLVIASYVAGEAAPDRLARTADALWSAAAEVLAVIEPGTPAGFARIRALRAHLVAQGARVLAPCPHDRACPIVDPDWCHFAQRLGRSRNHRRIKAASLAFEDEKFSYVAFARREPRRIAARVLSRPRLTKATVEAKLCTADGIRIEATARRDRERYKARSRWRWGDAVIRRDSTLDRP